MSQPKHWQQEGAPPDFVRLLRAARSEQPTPASIQRALLAAGLVGTASLVSTSAAASAGNATGKGLASLVAKWVAIGAVGAGTTATTAAIVTHRRTAAVHVDTGASTGHTQRVLRQDNVVAPLRREVRPALTVVEPIAPMGATTSRAIPASPRPTVTLRPIGDNQRAPTVKHHIAESAQPTQPVAESTLANEMALIDMARAKLRAGSAADALQSATEYNRRFSAGRFAPEAFYLIMQARKQLGQHQAATDAAREIIQRFPDGPHVGRARELLQSQRESNIP